MQGIGRATVQPVVVLVRTEPRQHLVPRPAGIAQGSPAVVVGALTAHVDHAVDRGAAAQHAPARIANDPATQPGIGLGVEHPVGSGVADAVQIAHRDMDPQVVIRPARLEQQHGYRRIGRQPVREEAPRRAGPHDHIVECFGCGAHRQSTHHDDLADRFAPRQAIERRIDLLEPNSLRQQPIDRQHPLPIHRNEPWHITRRDA